MKEDQSIVDVLAGKESIKFDLEFTNKTIAQFSVAAILVGILLVFISKSLKKWA